MRDIWANNNILNDPDLTLQELERYKQAGGVTLVDQTSRGLGQDALGRAPPAPVGLGHQGARGRPGADPAQHRAHPLLLRQLRRPGRDRGCRAAARRGRRPRPAQAAVRRREDRRPLPARAGHARRRPVREVSSGEQRTSNFLLWQSAYAEMVFQDRLWPDYDRRDLWAAIQSYVDRERRYGGAVDAPTGEVPTDGGGR